MNETMQENYENIYGKYQLWKENLVTDNTRKTGMTTLHLLYKIK